MQSQRDGQRRRQRGWMHTPGFSGNQTENNVPGASLQAARFPRGCSWPFGAVLGAVFFQLPFCRKKKKINLSLLDQNDFLLLSWAAGTVCAGLALRAPPARSPPPQNLPGACVGRGTKRTENPLGSGFAVQGGINPGTAAARSLPTGLGIFQQEAAAICTGRDAPRCSVSMGRGQG